MKKIIFLVIFLFSNITMAAADKVVNVYAWGGEIPKKLVHQFEKETGIQVNFSTYDNNETLYAKLHASSRPIYDVILPSTYFVERLKRQGFLKKLDHKRLTGFEHLDSTLLNASYDRHNEYSVPLVWGATGIFYNQQWVQSAPTAWRDCWDGKWRRQLMLLDDPREIFSIALISLGYSPNDDNPEHIHAAFKKLKALVPNIKLFASESIQAILIDEDAHIGTAWNGDVFKAQEENQNIEFVFPEEGFVIWIDCLSILHNAPHPDEAYAFINFLLKPENAAEIALSEGHAIANKTARALLPKKIRDNATVYPSPEILKRGVIQADISEKSLLLYDEYWQKLKFSFY